MTQKNSFDGSRNGLIAATDAPHARTIQLDTAPHVSFCMLVIASLALLLALLPTCMVVRNLQRFRRAPETLGDSIGQQSSKEEGRSNEAKLSVLIPARNEADGIEVAIECILRSEFPNFELRVLDDHSEDNTARIVEKIAQRDPRVSLHLSATLPPGWNGKQHACWQLANLAKGTHLLFLDADLRVMPRMLARCLAEIQEKKIPLVSGFPRQETLTFAEQMLIPMMHFLLLGYLPFRLMQSRSDPAFAAGCGQLFLVEREAYFVCGGHQAIADSRHDGLKLPAAFRQRGFLTDCFDASDIANVRMYTNRREVVNGLLKNADEGIAKMPQLLIFSILLLGAAVLPFVSLAVNLLTVNTLGATISALACVLALAPRAIISLRIPMSMAGVLLHPIAVLWFVIIQWRAYLRKLRGKSIAWRGRSS